MAGCGAASRIGADDYFDEGKAMYSIDLPQNSIIHSGSFEEGTNKAYEKVIYSEGKLVPMKTGGFADWYFDGSFYDTCNPLTEYKLQELGDMKSIQEFYQEWKDNSMRVNVNQFLRSLSSEELEALSGYSIYSINWDNVKSSL